MNSILSPPIRDINVYFLPGSQYSAKVLIGLDSRKIPHITQEVHIKPSKRRLPSGGILVPEITFCDSVGKVNIVSDSNEIFRTVDDKIFQDYPEKAFFPGGESGPVATLEKELDKELGALLLYYNWIWPVGYRRTMQMRLMSKLPGCLPAFLKRGVINAVTKGKRTAFKKQIREQLGKTDTELGDEAGMRNQLFACLERLGEAELITGTSLSSDKEGCILLNAAQCDVYAFLERFLGGMGDFSLTKFGLDGYPASLPELADEISPGIVKLLDWHQQVRKIVPVRFYENKKKGSKGKKSKESNASSIEDSKGSAGGGPTPKQAKGDNYEKKVASANNGGAKPKPDRSRTTDMSEHVSGLGGEEK